MEIFTIEEAINGFRVDTAITESYAVLKENVETKLEAYELLHKRLTSLILQERDNLKKATDVLS